MTNRLKQIELQRENSGEKYDKIKASSFQTIFRR